MERLPPEKMRLRILRILEAGRSQPVRDGLILQVLYERQLGVTLQSIRGHLDWLRSQNLITLERRGGDWQAQIAELGIAVITSAIEPPDGLADPKGGSS